ncbi:hypothetical protein N9B82_01840 [Saprospiraceae bacterium]|nr:hypothetical protein [Saprospiraceae bacterium]
MKRRNAVKGIFLFTLGTPLLFSCSDPYSAVNSLGLQNLQFENNDLKIIERISRLIVPINNIPQLAEHTTLPFLMKVVNDVYKAKDKMIFEEAYKNFPAYFNKLTNSELANIDDRSLETMLKKLNSSDRKPADKISTMEDKIIRFYDILKSENLQYLRTSKHIMEQYRYYEMAPGRYNGNFPISELPNPIK